MLQQWFGICLIMFDYAYYKIIVYILAPNNILKINSQTTGMPPGVLVFRSLSGVLAGRYMSSKGLEAWTCKLKTPERKVSRLVRRL